MLEVAMMHNNMYMQVYIYIFGKSLSRLSKFTTFFDQFGA